jgi:hypothetical protein
MIELQSTTVEIQVRQNTHFRAENKSRPVHKLVLSNSFSFDPKKVLGSRLRFKFGVFVFTLVYELDDANWTPRNVFVITYDCGSEVGLTKFVEARKAEGWRDLG